MGGDRVFAQEVFMYKSWGRIEKWGRECDLLCGRLGDKTVCEKQSAQGFSLTPQFVSSECAIS